MFNSENKSIAAKNYLALRGENEWTLLIKKGSWEREMETKPKGSWGQIKRSL